jgi:hypothetical protein
MPRPSHSSRFYHQHNSRRGVQIMELLIMKFFPQSCYLVPLRPKYSPQHPILKHPQSKFLPQFHRLSFTPTQNGQTYSSFKATTKFDRLKWPNFTNNNLTTQRIRLWAYVSSFRGKKGSTYIHLQWVVFLFQSGAGAEAVGAHFSIRLWQHLSQGHPQPFHV